MTDVTATVTADQSLTVSLPPSLDEEERRLLAELLNRLHRRAIGHVERVILFGSRARGEAWEWWGDYKKRDVNWTDEQLRQLLTDAERFVTRVETFLKEREALD